MRWLLIVLMLAPWPGFARASNEGWAARQPGRTVVG